MKLFKVTVDKPYLYAQSCLGETSCLAYVKSSEAIVVAETKKEADEKIRATLPPKDPNTENILMQSGNGREYYNIQIKEMEGKDGVYFC